MGFLFSFEFDLNPKGVDSAKTTTRGSQWGGGFYGYRLKFWLFYGYRLTKKLKLTSFVSKS